MNKITSTKLFDKCLGSLYGSIIGDAMGEPSEGLGIEGCDQECCKHFTSIEEKIGWINDFEGSGTDDTVLRDVLIESLVRTSGYANIDDWAEDWLANYDEFFAPKLKYFFMSVLYTANKLKRFRNPRMAALGNIPCSSSAMCIAPVGLVNACNPIQAATQAAHLASLINTHDGGFCQDGAAAIATAVASSCQEDADVASVLNDAVKYLPSSSGARMKTAIYEIFEVAQTQKYYKNFRNHLHNNANRFFQLEKTNSLETVPVTLALIYLAKGDLENSLIYASNFGRDTDTMAAMAGAICGALHGARSIKQEWKDKVKNSASKDQEQLSYGLTKAAIEKSANEAAARTRLDHLI